MTTNPIGIMQGRLSPPAHGRIQAFPADSWKRELELAGDLGLAHIEWVYDVESADSSPLLTDPGAVREVVRRTGVKIAAVCGDYFRDCPVIRVDARGLRERVERVARLCAACRELEIPAVMIPFVDFSAIQGEAELPAVAAALRECLRPAREAGIKILLETNLQPALYRRLLEDVGDPGLGVNYDMGDCASLGHEPAAELGLLGPWLRGVHVKDRPLGGSTVPLGSGAVDFPTVFRALDKAGFAGPITLQTARAGDELELARRNRSFVRSLLCPSA